jgi:hypothetical protein
MNSSFKFLKFLNSQEYCMASLCFFLAISVSVCVLLLRLHMSFLDLFVVYIAFLCTDRFRHLHPTNYPDHYRKTVNNHYDNQLHQTINSMEKILLSQLEESRQMKPDENQQWRWFLVSNNDKFSRWKESCLMLSGKRLWRSLKLSWSCCSL